MLRANSRSTLLSRKHYDVCCIGGGPAAIAAAMRSVDFGKKVCIVEQNRLGGKDVWNGTYHSKSMWEMAKFSAQCRGSSFRRCIDLDGGSSGSSSGGAVACMLHKPDFCTTRHTINNLCVKREEHIARQLAASQVDVHKGKATFSSPHEVCVYSREGTFESISADYFVIATGSRPRRPPQFKPDGVHILNSEQIWSQPFPNSMLVIGGGALGSELAAVFANLGTTKVSMLERDHQILPRTDADVVAKVKRLYRDKGVRLFEGYDLGTLKVQDNMVHFAAKCIKTGQIHTDTVEKALIALGRTPNYEALGLENLANMVVANGRIRCDRFGRCVPFRHIYVAGDAAFGKTVRAAETQGRSVVEHMYSWRNHSGMRFSDPLETQIMFLDQEVAQIGWNETKCKKNAVAYRAATYSYEYVSRALAMNNTKGFVKIIVSKDRQQNVLGVQSIGPQASSIVEIASVAVQQRRQVHEFAALFVAYPSVAQAFEQAARSLTGQSMIKPGRLPGIDIFEWQPEKLRGRAYRGDEEQCEAFATPDWESL